MPAQGGHHSTKRPCAQRVPCTHAHAAFGVKVVALRELAKRIYACLRASYGATRPELHTDHVAMPGVGQLVPWDLGDGRGRLVAQPVGAGVALRPRLYVRPRRRE